ncbi:MAG: hypothetical protein JRE71_18790 [Deltaproteobacteria bacterium]|nr:hypothetical protein [Deltaproteobacteria bacterium]
MTQSTDAMIRELAADLAPVKPLGRVRDTVLTTLGISLPFYGYWLITSGLREQFRQGGMPDFVYSMVAIALLLIAVGGLAAGLAAVIPGREDDARLGRNILFAGLALGILVLFTQWSLGITAVLDVSGPSVQCAMAAGMLAIPSALLVARFTFMARGAARHFPRALSLACAGGMGVSSGVVHLTCSHADPLHLVLGHAFAPFAGGLVVLIVASITLGIGTRLRQADRS